MIIRTACRVGKTYQRAFSGVPRNVWLLSFVLLVNRSGTMVLPFLALYFTKDLGFSKAMSGYFLACYGLGGIAGAYLGGYLCGKIGSIRVQIASMTGTAIGFVVLSQLKTFVSISMGLFLLSVIAEAVRPANTTAITEHSPKEKYRQSLAVNRLMMNLGMSIGPTIGGFLAFYNYKLLFFVDAATCGLAVLLLLFLFIKTGGSSHADRASDPSGKEPKNASLQVGKSPWRDPVFMAFWGLLFLTAVVFFQVIATKPIYLAEKFRLTEWQIGIAFALNTVIIVLFEMVLVQLVDRYRTLKIIAWGCFLSCIGFGILPYGYGFWFCLLSVTIWTFGEILSMPIATAFAAERSDEKSRGAYMGAYTMCYALAFVVGPLAGSWVYQVNRELVWHLGMLVGFVVLIGYHILDWISKTTEKRPGTSEDSQ